MRCRQGQDSVRISPRRVLLQHFRHELNTDLQKELTCRNTDLDLDSTITLAIKLDQQQRAVSPARKLTRFRAVATTSPSGKTPVMLSDDTAGEFHALGG